MHLIDISAPIRDQGAFGRPDLIEMLLLVAPPLIAFPSPFDVDAYGIVPDLVDSARVSNESIWI